MTRLLVRSFCVAGAAGGPSAHPGVRRVPGGEAVGQALRAHYPPLKLRRLDAYAQAALLAARMALEDAGCAPDEPGLIVCTGLGPIPATNAFMDSYMDFGPQGASPTAFSQTVHNLAASTISMTMGLTGPALSVSQPGLGLSGALVTARSWLELGLADTILFGAVDDRQAFSGELFPGYAASVAGGDPAAAFAVLSGQASPGDLLEVRDVTFHEQQDLSVAPAQGGPGPVDVLSAFLTVLDGQCAPSGETRIEEFWVSHRAVITVALPGQRSGGDMP